MILRNVMVVVRHNTQLGGDLHLAKREFDALAGKDGMVINNRASFCEVLNGVWDAGVVELAADGGMVGCLYSDVDVIKVDLLLRRSAFAQEVIIFNESEDHLIYALDNISLPSHMVRDISGEKIVVSLSQGYIIESEAILDGTIMVQRVKVTAELLLEPYAKRKLTPKTNRLRKAKKTTLSLSHDLHIYKAKFFPRMIRALLNIFGNEKATVLDPYCGSGTALLEASLLGMNSFGCDIDPICHLISKTKVTPFVEKKSLAGSIKKFEEGLSNSRESMVGFAFPEELRGKIERRDRKNQTDYLGEILEDTGHLATALAGLSRDNPEDELLFTLASDAVTKKIRYRFVGVGNGRYTIEIVRQPLIERMREKISRIQQLASVFDEIEKRLNTKLGSVTVSQGDARDRKTWPIQDGIDVIVTSPPYLPASSGREHYASSRALAFSVLGYHPGEDGYFDNVIREEDADFDVTRYPESAKLMAYLESDANDNADPQRDAMRFERKAVPTLHYLSDIRRFLDSAKRGLSDNGVLLLVVAHHHIFYSHRRMELEHVVSCRNLYAEIAEDVGLVLEEEIEMELKKAATTRARPMAKEDYYESVLVFRASQSL